MPTLLSFKPSPPCSLTSCRNSQSLPIACASPINRRNVCLGGGLGLCGALQGNTAFASPIQPPDITDTTTCQTAADRNLSNPVNCCPPYGGPPSPNIIDFTLPNMHAPLRIRKPAHKLTPWETGRFRAAVRTMKEFDKDHPWNFMQQAQIHCAFCNGAYRQVGYPDVRLQIHGSWIFLPWHRYYLYFWEKILGKIIDDPTFAIPYWEWDDPEGMEMPSIFKSMTDECNNNENPLYDCNRNPDHVPATIDLKYARGGQNDQNRSREEIIHSNLYELHSVMTDYLGIPECFLGFAILQGQVRGAKGRFELVHDAVHTWVGLSEAPFRDMGTFHTAARDPIFFAHHANIDRLWALYSKRRRNKVEFPTDDWLEASFVFYDENNKVVKCKVRDCLDQSKLGYEYKETGTPAWSDVKTSRKNIMWLSSDEQQMIPVYEFGDNPRVLNETIRVLVTRPNPSIAQDEVEVIRFTDFKFDPRFDARFDVYIAKPENGYVSASDLGEYVGNFIHILHSDVGSRDINTELCLAIASPLKDIGGEESDQLVVSLVPRCGTVTINPFRIVDVRTQSF